MDLFYYCYSLLSMRCYFKKFSLLMTVDNLWQKWPLLFLSVYYKYMCLYLYTMYHLIVRVFISNSFLSNFHY